MSLRFSPSLGYFFPRQYDTLKSRLSFGLALCLLIVCSLAQAADLNSSLDGQWKGTLHVGDTATLPVELHLAQKHPTLVSPQQSDEEIPIVLKREQSKVVFDVPAIGGHFEGQLNANGDELTGNLKQNGFNMPVSFKRSAGQHSSSDSSSEPKRPQRPTPPYPYRSTDVSFKAGDGVQIAGTYTHPKGDNKVPAVVLIGGSGAADRDETAFRHKYFLVLADYLTRHGIAVLRYDKRGIGKSGGDAKKAGGPQIIGDARAALGWLGKQPDVDTQKLGLIGHSEGGFVAPVIAANNPNVAYLVVLSAAGMPGDKLFILQMLASAEAAGADSAAIKPTVDATKLALEATRNIRDNERAHEAVLKALANKNLPAAQKNSIAKQFSSPETRWLASTKPEPVFEKIQQPILVIAGDKDLQVPAKQNLPPIRAALKHNKHARIIEYPDINHVLQPAQTGMSIEYAQIETTIAPKILDAITHWIQTTTANDISGR